MAVACVRIESAPDAILDGLAELETGELVIDDLSHDVKAVPALSTVEAFLA